MSPKLKNDGDWGYFGTGSAISKDFAITVKHLIRDKKEYCIKIQSECSTSKLSHTCKQHFAVEFVTHDSKSVDLALVKVVPFFDFSAFLPPFSNLNLYNFKVCQSASWGITDYSDPNSWTLDLQEMGSKITKIQRHKIWTSDVGGKAVCAFVSLIHPFDLK